MSADLLRLKAEWYRHGLHDTKETGLKELRILVRAFGAVLLEVVDGRKEFLGTTEILAEQADAAREVAEGREVVMEVLIPRAEMFIHDTVIVPAGVQLVGNVHVFRCGCCDWDDKAMFETTFDPDARAVDLNVSNPVSGFFLVTDAAHVLAMLRVIDAAREVADRG